MVGLKGLPVSAHSVLHNKDDCRHATKATQSHTRVVCRMSQSADNA
jgi:hypothetical protein